MELVCRLLDVYLIVIFGRIILSWFPTPPGGVMAGLQSFAYTLTEPVLAPLRRVLPTVGFGGMGLDLSPIILIFGARILQGVICT
ncbi:MAG: YggT family protein [Actinobacteria bacterium]|nr:YggT family protein [Actinomycetota bacterium]